MTVFLSFSVSLHYTAYFIFIIQRLFLRLTTTNSMQNKSEKTNDRISMITRWEESGKSINSFCKHENIPYFTFMYWRKKLSGSNKSGGFIKIKRKEFSTSNCSACEIIFANGNRVNFSDHPEVLYLKQLLR